VWLKHLGGRAMITDSSQTRVDGSRCTRLVNGPGRVAVYNLRIAQMLSSLPGPSGRLAVLALALFLLSSSFSRASDWDPPAHELARKIAAVIGPAPVSLDLVNRSGLGKKDIDQSSLGVRAQLGSLGVRIVPAEQATATVQLSISENLQSYVWVAEIRQGSESSTAIVATPRLEVAFQRDAASTFTLRKVPLWAQE